MIQQRLADAIRGAITDAQAAGELPAFEPGELELQRPQRPEHGDWTTSVAMTSQKAAGMKPRDLAQVIAARLTALPEVAAVEVAGPGFLNFRLTHAFLTSTVREVERAGGSWGRSQTEKPERVQIEFVSANPTGPLHVGHGRWAVVGDAITTLLEATGQTVEREFYINDHGNQMVLFGQSLAARYRQALGEEATVPQEGYQGSYLVELAREILEQDGRRYAELDEHALPNAMRELGRERIISQQRDVLERLGVRFDVWFSETTLHAGSKIGEAIDELKKHGHTYEDEGAMFLRTTDFGDDKDRVLVRATGEPTYFAADVAYFIDKKSRGFDRLVYLWGADHHGYVARLRAVVRCLDEDADKVEILIGQLVNLTRGGVPVRMSKRTGELVTFEELLDEVGVDAARYTFLRQGIDTALDFDIEQAVKRSQDNPVFYVQYAHARISSIIAYAAEQGVNPAPIDDVALERLDHPSEVELIRKIDELPEAVAVAARFRAPHRLTRYAEDLASLFHGFYRDCRVVTEDSDLTQARLHLCIASRIALANVLRMCGVSAPEKM